MQDRDVADGSAARARYVRLYRIGLWIALAIIAAGSWWSDATLAADVLFLGLIGTFVIGVAVVRRASLAFADEKRRMLLEQLVAVTLLTVVVIAAGPPLRGSMFVLVLPVALAPLLIGGRRAHAVLAAAVLGALVIGAAAWPTSGRAAAVDAGVASVLFAFVHFFTARLVQVLAAMRRHLIALSDRDPLTGAYHFSGFIALAERVHDQAAAARRPYGVLIVDIDDLGAINERFGYAAGSRAIRLVATALERLRAPDELMTRYDGDKLALLLPELEGARASDLAQRIRNVVFATTLNVDTEVVRIKANVGIAKYPVDATTLDGLLSKAEADMRTDRAGREPPATKPVFKRRSGTKSG